jgi:drug/metabolite transporter (DMT)-like permease
VTTIILGFATSLVYGFADFFGALASKKIKPVTVTFLAGLVGLGFVSIMSLIFGATFSPGAWFWGIAAGFAAAIGMTALYAALAIGPISVVSPLSAVVSAIVPMIVGFFLGERFSPIGFGAIAAIVVAVFLVGFVPGDDVRLPSTRALILGIIAGVGIGVVLICVDQAPSDSGLAPVILLRGMSAAMLGIFTLTAFMRARGVKQEKREPIPAKYWISVALAGIFDASANIFFLTGMRLGSLTVVSVLTALYPLGTIILARIFLKERLAKTQQLGIMIALLSSAILAVA